jgi:VanZ family protein
MRKSQVVDGALWLLTAVCFAEIMDWSIKPHPDLPFGFTHADKAYHALAYAALTFSLLLAAVWRPGRGAGPVAHARWIMAATIGLGVSLEVIQGFVGRDPDVADAMMNAFGAFLAYSMWMAIGAESATRSD